MDLSELLFNTYLDIGKSTNSSMLNAHHQETAGEISQGKENSK